MIEATHARTPAKFVAPKMILEAESTKRFGLCLGTFMLASKSHLLLQGDRALYPGSMAPAAVSADNGPCCSLQKVSSLQH